MNIELIVSNLLTRLQLARDSQDYGKTKMIELIQAVKDTDEYKNAELIVNEAKTEIDKVDPFLRRLAVRAFLKTGEKSPYTCLKVRETTELTITDYDAAMEWAMKNPTFLKIDESALLKHAKAVSATQPLPFISITKVPAGTISQDIAKVAKQ